MYKDILMAENKTLSRRSFLKFLQKVLAATGMAAIAGPIVAYFWPTQLEEVPSEPVPVGPEDSIPVGEAKVIRYGRYPALVIHTSEGIRSYSAVCTHFACIVKWDPEINQIVCPCHEGFFDPIDGSVISGPPPRPLDVIPHFVQGGTLFIGGEA
jgi:cytochrome b6-f complex iron-sulfur subunit